MSLSLRLHAGLANGQVLQRDSQGEASVELHFTGIDATSSLIATLFNGDAVLQSWTFASPAADPSIRLDPISTGGPYDLRLENGSSTVTVRGFFVGDVWLLAGQSNMQGWGLLAGAVPPHPRIRAFTMRREWTRAVEPMHLLAESPDVCHHGGTQCSAAESRTRRRQAVIGTGPGPFFAREMLERTGVPQGLLCCAHAGTSLTQWTPEPLIDGETSMYGSLLQSVQATAQPVAGVLWYQGESDATPDAAPAYTARMERLVAALRRHLAQPRLPWIMVQLARRFGRRRARRDQQLEFHPRPAAPPARMHSRPRYDLRDRPPARRRDPPRRRRPRDVGPAICRPSRPPDHPPAPPPAPAHS